jgi:peptidoglycan hydrolase-like protein with peptidoglycan-binding domain
MDDENDDVPRRAGRPLWWRVVVRNPRDSSIAIVAAAAMTAIVVNGLFLQPGPHPAPIFAVKSPIAAVEQTGTVMMPRPRPPTADAVRRDAASPVPPAQAARARNDIVTDIQRELARRSFYDGAVDGVYGSRTDAALRDFEQASGVKTAGDVSEVTLQTILRAPAKSKTPLPAPAPPRRDAIAELIAPPLPSAPSLPSTPTPSRQLIAVQRVLGDFGYGQVKPTGTFDGETRAAIERFERDRNMPITGQLSDRLVRELGMMTGRPLD